MKRLWKRILGWIPAIRWRDAMITRQRATIEQFQAVFLPAQTDAEWVKRIGDFGMRVQRQLGPLHGIAAEHAALMGRVELALDGGDLNAVHAFLQGPKRPATHTQRHNDLLSTIEEMRQQRELPESYAKDLQRDLSRYYLGITRSLVRQVNTIDVDAEGVEQPKGAVPASRMLTAPKTHTRARRLPKGKGKE